MLTIVDSSIKNACCLLSIHKDGYSTLFKHPEGFLLSPSSPTKNSLLVFAENRNAHKARAGLAAVLVSCVPQHIVKGTFIPHEIVLIQGIVLNSEDKNYILVYHKRIKTCNRIDLYDIISSNVSNLCVVDELFEQEP